MTKEEAKKFFMDRKNASLVLSDEEIKKAEAFCEGYKDFMSKAKTEREINIFAIKEAEKKGFKNLISATKFQKATKFISTIAAKPLFWLL